ncbi:MAG: helix-turn-helix domain-containing protein [Clostridia bacterium]|nr:helix-turn-helix domain-containing protein [Clostridia bacterium]
MQNKDFDYNSIEVLCSDLKIVFITDETTTRSGDTNVHMHSFWEMFYLQDGCLTVNTETQQFKLSKNQMMIIPPNCYHSTFSDSEVLKKSVFFTFEKIKSTEKEKLYDKISKAFGSCGFYKIDDSGYAGILLDMVLDSYASEKLGKEWRVKANVTELIFALYDLIKDGALTAPENEIRPNTYWVYKYAIDRLLDIYYMTDISLESLSEKLFVSPKTITRIISSAYGKSFNELKLELRMRNAQKLLKETDLTIGEIGERVGYTTPRGFFLAFQKYSGSTPGEYRKNKTEKEGGEEI